MPPEPRARKVCSNSMGFLMEKCRGEKKNAGNGADVVTCKEPERPFGKFDVKLARVLFSIHFTSTDVFPIDFVLLFSRRRSHDIQTTLLFFSLHNRVCVCAPWNRKAFEHSSLRRGALLRCLAEWMIGFGNMKPTNGVCVWVQRRICPVLCTKLNLAMRNMTRCV